MLPISCKRLPTHPLTCNHTHMATNARISNMNHYNQPTIANAYREIKFRASWEQYQKLNELCGATGFAASEILRRLINVATLDLVRDIEGIIPVRLDATFDNPLDHIEGMCPKCGLFECNCPA